MRLVTRRRAICPRLDTPEEGGYIRQPFPRSAAFSLVLCKFE